MNICLNFYGQPRNVQLTLNTFNNCINTSDVTFHILYTTWDKENIDEFKQAFPNAFIRQYQHPDLNNYTHITNNYIMDPTNQNLHRSIQNSVFGLYIKSMTEYTINDYEFFNNIKFDFIITARTDIYLNMNICCFYKYIIDSINDNSVYVAHEPTFTIYPEQPSIPDAMFIANRVVTLKIIKQVHFLQHCVVKNTNYIHPESSFFNALSYLGLHIEKLNYTCFPHIL